MNQISPSDIQIIRSRTDLQTKIRSMKANGKRIGFVPTMGALHDGHLSLVHKALDVSDIVIASIYVNPTQFAPGEDFDAYPRNTDDDLEKLKSAGCQLAYLPTTEDMYPEGTKTDVRVEGLSDLLDGVYRPHFFYGVSTAVARLFMHVQPDTAVFGEKDYQQLQIIRRMVTDLGFPIDIIGGETRRDVDGLAQSSRNLYLDQNERRIAGALQAALMRAGKRTELGAHPAEILQEARTFVLAAGFDSLDYISLVDPATLEDLPNTPLKPGQVARLLGAGWVGQTRLIDNIAVSG